MVTKRPTPKKSPAPKRREPKKRASLDPTLTADLVALGRRIPDSELANLPRDGAARFDEYYVETLN
jgi:hypothetical protein